MRIIIAGAGAVGTHLATLLSKENQDIVLMDEDMDKLKKVDSNFDLMTYNESPSSIKAQKSAGVAQADLFIGVTPDENRNMTCCMIASNLGCKKTVARIDNYEYLNERYKEFFQHMGIDMLVYPELLAAKEIAAAVKMSWIRQWWEVGNGELVLIGVKVRKTAQIINIPLKELGGADLPYHIVAVKRREDTLIPHGEDVLRSMDTVYFMTTKKYIPYVRQICGKEDYPDVRNILIMGGGRVAMRTAEALPDYMNITIIEQDEKRCERLTELLPNREKIMIINGDGRDMNLLEDEGIRQVEAFIALTGNAETNILACLAAKRMGVRKTVAIVENLDYMKMAESLDIGTIINKKTIAAGRIYQMMLDADVTNMKTLELAQADVAEFSVSQDAKITHRPVKDLGLPKGVTIGGLVRNGEGMLVQGNTMIQPNDHVVVFSLSNLIKKIEKYF